MGLLSIVSNLFTRFTTNPALTPSITITKDATSGTRLNYARALDQSGQSNAAAAIYWDMLEKDPNELGAAQNLSDILIRKNQPADAIAVLAVLLDRYPNYSGLWCNFSAALSAIGDHERAFAAANQAVTTDPGNAMAYYNRAKCHWQFKRNFYAIQDYDKAVACDPSNLEIAEQLRLARFAVSDNVHTFGAVKHEMRAHGAFIADGVEIASTLQCPHCNGHFPSTRTGTPKCLNCGDYTCGHPDCLPCRPYKAVLEESFKISNAG